jgi:membrane fusion protein, multidrug efflux system
MNSQRFGFRTASLILVLGTGVGVAACRNTGADAETPPDHGVTIGAENIAVVQVDRIRTGPAIAGSLEPDEQAMVRAEVAGAVLQTFFETGQHVSKGAELARIDDSAIRDQALSAHSAVTTAQNASDIAQRNLQRSEALLKAGAIADRDLESARNAALAAQASLEDARARDANAQKTLDKTHVLAPFDGVVSARSVNGGDIVSVGTALFSVVNPGSMRLEASVPANQLGDVKVGMPVDFAVTGYPGRHFEGHITRVNPTADPATRQVKLLAKIPNAGNTLVGGLFAEGRVNSESHTSAVIPIAAVDERGLRPSVVAIHGGKAEKVEVELGIRDATAETVEIRNGLKAGDTILVGAARGISPGTPVRVSTPTDSKR